jgi:hypothetical protein
MDIYKYLLMRLVEKLSSNQKNADTQRVKLLLFFCAGFFVLVKRCVFLVWGREA